MARVLTEGLVFPVVGAEIVEGVALLVAHHVAEGGIGVEGAVGIEELFALGGGEYGVAELIDDAHVGIGHCLSGGEVVVKDVFVVEALVEVRHVGFGIADDIVVRDLARVHPPAAFELHFGIARFTLLGGDEHHTVGTARTVECGRSGVFEHRDVVDVIGVDRREVAVVGNAVEDDEGIHLGIDRTETADADGGGGAGLTVVAGGLHAGHGAVEGARNVGDLTIFELLRAHRGGRPCE